MSWAEDEGFDDYDQEDTLEGAWSYGYHCTKDNDIIELSLMTDSHLKNTIRYFKDKYDTTSLQNELKRRDIIRHPS